MSEDSIDYKAVTESLQHENERLRMRLLTIVSSPSPLVFPSFGQIKDFVEDNYILIIVAVAILTNCSSLFKVLSRRSTKDSKE